MSHEGQSEPSASKQAIPKLGPEPTLLSRKEIDALYETLEAVLQALKSLNVDAIVTGGSLLGAIRQHSILFCDDDVDLTIIDYDGTIYDNVVRPNLQALLGEEYLYQIRPWEGGDKIRPKRMSNVFLDLFVLRRFQSLQDLQQLIGVKKNGQPQSESYIQGIIEKITACAGEESSLCPFWHFSTRKAVEMWSKEVYRESELFPLDRNLKMGPVTGICGPRMPIKLLKRAFGDDCFDVYFQSVSHRIVTNAPVANKDSNTKATDLKPLIAPGGTWEGGVKTALEDIHYLPMQPLSRAARRPTLHDKQQLQRYLASQSIQEDLWTNTSNGIPEHANGTRGTRPNKTVYLDGIFDLFHIGHLEAIQQCGELGNRVIIGVTGDHDATGYKRRPIVPEHERRAIVGALKVVDKVICPCPLVVTEDFMETHGIDLVVHGFANDADARRQEEFFHVPMTTGRFQRISYYQGMSTTDRIRNIQSLLQDDADPNDISRIEAKAKESPWFGRTLSEALCSNDTIPFDPFPFHLRQVVESHIEKARQRRREALHAIREATRHGPYDDVMQRFRSNLGKEDDFTFDTSSYPLLESLLQDCNLPKSFDLSIMHENVGQKEQILEQLTIEHSNFQATFDKFVREICAPQMAKHFSCTEIYYQAFPCLRIVHPDEFSIGPHSDVAYGHHPCSVNFYVPLTKIGGTASLFLETRPGAEDWHPIEGSYGCVKQFAGATCLHWTTENKCDYTRVSLDVRLIPGDFFHVLKCGSAEKGGQKDVYRENDGYYSKCHEERGDDGSTKWIREGPLLSPDARVGFPWTVKDWSKYRQRTNGKRNAPISKETAAR